MEDTAWDIDDTQEDDDGPLALFFSRAVSAELTEYKRRSILATIRATPISREVIDAHQARIKSRLLT